MSHTQFTSQVTYEKYEEVGIITIDSPPVNAISVNVIDGLEAGLTAFELDQSRKALVICCSGKTFVAGGDIKEFERDDFSTAPFNRVLDRIECQSRPTVVALHGHVLGGGLELAMACHARVALPGTRLGLPEVKLGLLPGSLGTQRLPRLVPVPVAVELMLSGRPIPADQALALELIDAVHPGHTPRDVGIEYANWMIANGKSGRKTRLLPVRSGGLSADYFEQQLREVLIKQSAYPAAIAIVESVRAAVELTFEEGEQVEARHFEACRKSHQSESLRHLFFAERQVSRIPGFNCAANLRDIRKVGIVGAGTMGGGIAMNFINIGIPTVILDTQSDALERGISVIRKNYQGSVDKGRLAPEDAEKRMSCLIGTLNYADLSDCDLVIEAVFEDMALKQQVIGKLGSICKSGAIIATNTSTLNIDVIANASGRAADVVGTHFFSPANVMRLLEVVRGACTAPDVLLTVMDLARRIGKVAVVSGVCYGFIGNRMAEPYLRECEFLLMEGALPTQIDAAVEDAELLGMAMGPCRMLDMAGIDVGAKTLIELSKIGGLPNDPSYRAVCQTLHAQGRFGQKTGAGYYRYEGRTPVLDPQTTEVCIQLAKQFGIEQRVNITQKEIVERLMLPLINEAAKILEEGISLRAGDIDVVWTAGYGFPDHRGGPLWLADVWSLQEVVERIEYYAKVTGNQFGYWSVSPLLKQLAERGLRISEWVKSE